MLEEWWSRFMGWGIAHPNAYEWVKGVSFALFGAVFSALFDLRGKTSKVWKKYVYAPKVKAAIEDSPGSRAVMAGGNIEEQNQDMSNSDHPTGFSAGRDMFFAISPSAEAPNPLEEEQRQVCEYVKKMTNGTIDFYPDYQDIANALSSHNDHHIAACAYKAYRKLLIFLSDNTVAEMNNVGEFIAILQGGVSTLDTMKRTPNDCANARRELKKCEEATANIWSEWP